MSDETIEKTFQVTAPARLIISNVRGSVAIQPGEANVIEVKAVKHGNFDNDRNRVEMTQDADGSVRVETRSNEAMFGFFSYPPKVDYFVRVPQGIHLEASCISSTLKWETGRCFQIKDHQRRCCAGEVIRSTQAQCGEWRYHGHSVGGCARFEYGFRPGAPDRVQLSIRGCFHRQW